MRWRHDAPALVVLFVVLLMLPSALYVRGEPMGVDLWSETTAVELNTSVDIYFLNLPEVGSYINANISKVLEGVQDITADRTLRNQMEPAPIVFWTAITNFTLTVVDNWSDYRSLLEKGDNFILINGHDQYFPVPAPYPNEGWMEVVLDAMANRHVIWAHIGGYPFFHAWKEGAGPEEWGPEGFRMLTTFAAWSNTTVAGSLEGTERRWASMAGNLGSAWTWWEVQKVTGLNLYQTEVTATSVVLTGSNRIPDNRFQTGPFALFELWELREGSVWYYPGFSAKVWNPQGQGFGVYVHFTPGTLIDRDGQVSGANMDYARGVVGALGSMLWEIGYPMGVMENAETEIRDRGRFGYKIGLDEAGDRLSLAKSEFVAGHNLRAASLAEESLEMALNARAPSALERVGPTFVATAGSLGAVALALFGRRALNNRRTTREARAVRHPRQDAITPQLSMKAHT